MYRQFNFTRYYDSLQTHWVGYYAGFGVDDVYRFGTVWEQYMLSFYWIVSTLSTQGQIGQMQPQNLLEVRTGLSPLCALIDSKRIAMPVVHHHKRDHVQLELQRE